VSVVRDWYGTVNEGASKEIHVDSGGCSANLSFIKSEVKIVEKFKQIPPKNTATSKALVLLAFFGFVLTQPIRALTFNLTYDSSVTSQTNAAQIETAIGIATQTIQTLYTNSSTVNVTVYWGAAGPFSGGIDLGASQTEAIGDYTYAQLTNALNAARTTVADSNAVASLPPSDPIAGNVWIMAEAEAKALGLSSIFGLDPNDTNSNDGAIGFASDVSYTFDSTNRAVAGEFDFISVAEHELTEVMGRDNFGLNENDLYVPYDLFRFTASGTRSFNVNDSNVYFSTDNGVSVLKDFNPNNGGDIQDWTTSTPPDSYDAYISSGVSGKLSSADLTAVSIIGYNLNFTPPRLTGTKLANGNFKINFTNVTGMSFVVLASTNVSLSVSNWTNLGAPTESPIGQYQFTDTQANKMSFYRVSLP
jgi:hypothetical protein